MSIVGAVVVPHPPVILPQVGHGREQAIAATIRAYQQAAAQVARWQPDALVLSSPHTVLYRDYFHIAPGCEGHGDFAAFGAPQVALHTAYHAPLRAEIIRRAEAAGLAAGTRGQQEPELDHGVMIPLYFLQQAGVHCPIVRMGLSGFSPLEHYRLGACVAEAAQALGLRVVLVASGDLSHRLTPDGPYGFAPEGPVFDKAVTDALARGELLNLLTLDPALCGKAAECGLRSFQLMAGALDGLRITPQLLSYEGPFGVGYAVAVFTPQGSDPDRCYAFACREALEKRASRRRAQESPWVQLARLALEHYVTTGRELPRLPEGLPEELLHTAAGAFVSLHLAGQLRGCIGTIAPVTSCLAEEIASNAVAAGCRDPRFTPVRAAELPLLEYSVDVLGKPEAIDGPDALDVHRYGVIVHRGGRRGLLLPDLDGVDTVEQQIAIALQKAGIDPEEGYQMERFQVVRHT